MSASGDVAMAQTVRTALKSVIDPELGHNLVDLGLIYAVEVIDLCIVSITMTTTTRGCPATAYLKQAVHDCAKAVPGVQFVEVTLTHEPAWTPARIAPELAAVFKR